VCETGLMEEAEAQWKGDAKASRQKLTFAKFAGAQCCPVEPKLQRS